MNTIPPLRYLVASAILSFLLTSAAFSQTPGTGAISGVVYDPANHVVTDAAVAAVNDATQISRSVTTTSEGIYRIPLLPPGGYTVTVTAPGFSPNVLYSIQVTVSQTTSVNVTLAIGAVGQVVRVQGSPEIVDFERSTLGGVVDE